MNNKVFLYNNSDFEQIKVDFPEYRAVSFGFLLNEAPDVKKINKKFFLNKLIIDITNLGYENGYFRLFLDQYLNELVKGNIDSIFIANANQKIILNEKYPYLFEFDEEYINKDVKKIVNENKCIEKYIPISFYNKNQTDRYESDDTKSIGCLLEGVDVVNSYKINEFALREIANKSIKYIDITSALEGFKIRPDLIINFEFALRQIIKLEDSICFLLESEKKELLLDCLPFVFSNVDELENKDSNKIKDVTFEDNIEEIKNKLYHRLRGHEKFKNDFIDTLKKFIFLNKINERKLLSIFLMGESGVGKTEFAKILSNIVYPNEPLIKINFGNYTNEGVLNSLIGSPIGYVGSDEGGELINKIKKTKSKIILIDEFEKATPIVFNFFYELLEDGKFTDRHGNEHNLDGYILILTSNLTENKFVRNIPDPLKSRFDMVYRFTNLTDTEKNQFIDDISESLSERIKSELKIALDCNISETQKRDLIKIENLRNIKREIESIIVNRVLSKIEPDS